MLVALLPAPARAVTVTLSPSQDNTLYESASGAVSNGAGEYLFAGKTDRGLIRRALIQFDIAGSIPAGSTINSVSLSLNVSRTRQNTQRSTSVHRVLASWGEGGSNGDQNEGQGAPADTNDATWIHRSRYPDVLWASPGGDYVSLASASAAVGGNASYTWSGAGLVADTQGWLNNPATNFGWLVHGDESVSQTAKRFDSSENGTVTRRPSLVIDFTPAGGGTTGACCYDDTCDVVTAAVCASIGGTYQGDGTVCQPDPCPPPGTTVTVVGTQDNTLYQDATGTVSNGSGTKVIVSKNAASQICRAVLRFDLAPSIPNGATITAAKLTLYNAESATSAADVSVYRASAGWGEGTSVASGAETTGAPSTTGDATWIHRTYPGTLWTTAGGDFSATSSGLTSVTGAGFYSWTSPVLLSDVQGWVDNPATNFGWVIRGRETGGAGASVKRFESRETADPTRRPMLQITYAATSSGGCCLPDGSCEILTAEACATGGGTYQGDGTDCVGVECPLVLEAFVDSLPIPAVATPVTGTVGGVANYEIPVTEQWQTYHRDLPPTRVWGYAGSYPGPTIVASSGKQVTVKWRNDLRDSTGAPRTTHYLPVDPCVHGAEDAAPRIVSHLHGGHVEQSSDGYPTWTLLPGQSQTYTYPNKQLAGTLWYHDHALGITRLNVMMGMAGFYLLIDSVETALGLPSGRHEIGLAIQDRTLRSDGSIVYPATWEEHFFGDKAVVNGKVWPYLKVDQGKYRFRMLDGSTSRSYTLHLSTGAPFVVIGTEGGMLPAPVTVESLTLTPGERADVILDFAPYPAGTEILLTNTAPAPFPSGMPGEQPALPQIMKFIVQGQTGHTAPIPVSLRPVEVLQEADASVVRDLVLAKTSGGPCGGGAQWTINGLGFHDVREFPVLNSTEIWQFINRSGVTHPMHMHLTMFQILDRQAFVVSNDSIIPVGSRIPPPPGEAGWKDTAPVPPNTIVRVITRFEDYVGRYPYHCHILEHEENEMMRQFQVVHAPVTGVETNAPPHRLALDGCRPNPFNPETRIDFELPRDTRALLEVFDITGRRVITLVDGVLPAGRSTTRWNGLDSSGRRAASGVYSYRLTVKGEPALTRKMVLLK